MKRWEADNRAWEYIRRLEAWIKKAHHLDGCSWSRTAPMYVVCDCGRNELVGYKSKES